MTIKLQITFYTLAFGGYLWQRKVKLPPILGIPFSFWLVNLTALVGVARFLMGRKSGRWQRLCAVNCSSGYGREFPDQARSLPRSS